MNQNYVYCVENPVEICVYIIRSHIISELFVGDNVVG